MKRLFRLILVLCVSLPMPIYAAKSTVSQSNPFPPRGSFSWMIALSASSGAIKHMAKHRFQLVMPVSDVNQIMVYSRRPNRSVKLITDKALQQLWSTSGRNSLANIAPNATLSAQNLRQTIITLEGMEVKKNKTLIFTFKFNDDRMQKVSLSAQMNLKNIELVIDSGSAPTNATVCTNAGGQWYAQEVGCGIFSHTEMQCKNWNPALVPHPTPITCASLGCT